MLLYFSLKSGKEQSLQDSTQATAPAPKFGVCIIITMMCLNHMNIVIYVLIHTYVHVHVPLASWLAFFSTDDEPTLFELLCFDTKTQECVNIIDEVGAKYQSFGILLLEDKTGAHVRSLVTKHSKDCESINLEIVQEWLQGRGAKPVSWKTLTRILKAVKLTVIA